MEISFTGGRFVSKTDGLNYDEVLSDFQRAKIIRVMTYNISKNERQDKLMEALQDSQADVQVITNIPSRMPSYYDTESGRIMRDTARKNIHIYVSKLSPERFKEGFIPFFNEKNHAKIVGTENIVYIGSANFSNESANNIESGVLIEDKDFIRRLYCDFFDKVKEDSLSYFHEEFSAFRLFITALKAKFTMHHQKLITDLFTDCGHDTVKISDGIFLDVEDLDQMRLDFEEIDSVCVAAEETFDDSKELDDLKKAFDKLDIDWLIDVVSEGGSLYELVAYNPDEAVSEILDESYMVEAYDEKLEYYVEEARYQAAEKFDALKESFSMESDMFLAEIEEILFVLDKAIEFTKRNKVFRINPSIDNT